MKFYLVFLLFVSLSVAFAARHRNSKKWKAFKAKFKLEFANETAEIRKFERFEEVDKIIEFVNDQDLGFQLGHNEMSTWEDSQRKELLGLKRNDSLFKQILNGTKRDFGKTIYTMGPDGPTFQLFEPTPGFKIPDSIDYSKKWNPPARHQLHCGSCYSFSTTAAIEAHLSLKQGKSVTLSPQEIKDCSRNNGCHGGNEALVFEYVMRNGVCMDSDYPYIEPLTSCQSNKCRNKIKIKGFFKIQPNSEAALKEALVKYGPIAVGIDADGIEFSNYKTGIYSLPGNVRCTQNDNHAVLLMGYGIENGRKFWLIRNSWGATWGNNGLGKISADLPNNCGILNGSFAPIIA